MKSTKTLQDFLPKKPNKRLAKRDSLFKIKNGDNHYQWIFCGKTCLLSFVRGDPNIKRVLRNLNAIAKRWANKYE